MATWAMHLMIADIVLSHCPTLNRRGFCVGSVAPDCNIENETWTEFTPPREITHWMSDKKKTSGDSARFLSGYVLPRAAVAGAEEYAFLLGYWAHLIADAEHQRWIRDEDRVRAAWSRILADKHWAARAEGMEKTWDSVKQLFPSSERARDIAAFESEYLQTHPDSGFITELIPLTDFPDYIDYLPPGSIVRKIRNMRMPEAVNHPALFLAASREEFSSYVRNAASLILDRLSQNRLIP